VEQRHRGYEELRQDIVSRLGGKAYIPAQERLAKLRRPYSSALSELGL
jgi:hypothetical protein